MVALLFVPQHSIAPLSGSAPSYTQRIPNDGSVSIPVIREGTGLGSSSRPSTNLTQPGAQKTIPSSIVELKVAPTKHPVARLTRSVKGVASWYCKAGVSVCHYAYPPGSMVAAACGKLRRVMGPHWRHTRVIVSSGGHSVAVTLVDWCGSTTKLIDLYWEPMRRLGGSGTLPVVVRW